MSENIKSHGWRITNEQRIKVLSFLSSFDPKSEIEQRDKKYCNISLSIIFLHLPFQGSTIRT